MKIMSRMEFMRKTAGVGLIFMAGPAVEANPACGGTSGLSVEERNSRENLLYSDKSADPNQPCKKCALFIFPAAGKECGACNLVGGPIHPLGHCNSWVNAGVN